MKQHLITKSLADPKKGSKSKLKHLLKENGFTRRFFSKPVNETYTKEDFEVIIKSTKEPCLSRALSNKDYVKFLQVKYNQFDSDIGKEFRNIWFKVSNYAQPKCINFL